MKTLFALAALAALTTAARYIEGDPAWLATNTCSFADTEQCALEEHAKAVLRNGRVKVGD